jgi:8-oxo-dGTP pyrophosphatase MutT (NUDIX family)
MSYKGFLEKTKACNTTNIGDYIPFIIDQQQTGWIKPAFAELLAAWPEIFILNDESIQLANSIQGFKVRSETVDEVIHTLAQQGNIKIHLNEPYPVTAGDRNQAVMTLDRSAVPYFGLRSFGQHLNGYVRKRDGIHLWIARRARDRYIAPGKLDNMVAGGLPWHTSLEENLIKECAEEAGMDESLARQAIPTGTVSYLAESDKGIKPDTLYCYDIELPDNFTPVCTDGEVESFELMPVNKVMEIIRDADEFKLNCNLVIIDFLIRHGLLDPDQAGYAELVSSLHQ